MNNYILMLFIIVLAWIGIILFDYYTEFKKKNMEENTKVCYSLNWHASLLIFGILCGVAMGN